MVAALCGQSLSSHQVMCAPMLSKLKLVKTPKGIDSVLMLSAMLILWIGNYSNLDLIIADSMFDGARGQFIGAGSALAGGFQFGMTLLGAAVIGLAIWDTLRPLAWLASRRGTLRVVALSAVLVPLSIYFLSSFSDVPCPTDLLRYGGMEPYARLLETLPASASGMACLPATQANTAWWMLALPLFCLPGRPRTALLLAGVMLLCGLTAGWQQQLQGTQFFTHTLWSAWIASFLIYLLHNLLRTEDALA
ncbi:acid phosphatase [Janthinobacterium sp. FT14W]|uniref:acid phosphatase n=1 Tax=Janthinobacterium sp. FT14W TaxID=2654253 RepID=UPI0012654683|nr:acid phosphatase [Janthinobacterium sp. FT14W]KAB8049179.1 acid phosphatase [Janthinobacterium sp. FT14W]